LTTPKIALKGCWITEGRGEVGERSTPVQTTKEKRERNLSKTAYSNPREGTPEGTFGQGSKDEGMNTRNFQFKRSRGFREKERTGFGEVGSEQVQDRKRMVLAKDSALGV